MEVVLYSAVRDTPKRHNIRKALRLIGNLLLALSLIIIILTIAPLALLETRYRIARIQPAASLAEKAQVTQEASALGVNAEFSIVIPKIAAASAVIAHVNPGDEKAYKAALKTGVAHAAGTQLPGNKGTIYLFAHSASSPVDIINYNAVFYQLKELENGDEIIIFFAGQKYVYQVNDNFVTTAEDIRWLTDENKEEKLVLQTCWPPGTSLKRLIVIAKPA